jgi:excisionase family DNA binding protein
MDENHPATNTAPASDARPHCPASPWMTPVEAAAYLGIALGTLRNWTSAHFVPHAKKGRVVRYHRDALDRWLARGACTGRSTFADLSR